MKLAFWKKEKEPTEDIGMPPPGEQMPGFEEPTPGRSTDQMLETPMPGAEPTGVAEPSLPPSGFDKPIESRMAQPGAAAPEPTYAEKARLQPAPLEARQSPAVEKDLEVISAKLDVLKAGIDAISQRLELLEKEKRVRW